MSIFDFIAEHEEFVNSLNKCNTPHEENEKCACSCNKKQDEQHFCKDCKWCDCKNETILLCKNNKWNPSGESTIVRGNDFCSYWEKREEKHTLNQYEIDLLKFMKNYGYNFFTVYSVSCGAMIYFFKLKNGKQQVGRNFCYCKMNLFNEKHTNLISLLKDVDFSIDGFLKG